MKHYSKRIFVFCLMVVFLASIIIYSYFGERGLRSMLILTKELREIEARSQKIKEENALMEHAISLLKSDPKHIERVAREELGLVKPEEIIYLFDE